MYHSIYNRSIIEGKERAGKVAEKYSLYLYIEYIIKEYIRNMRKGEEMCGKECSSFVYRYSIIERKERGGAKKRTCTYAQTYVHYI